MRGGGAAEREQRARRAATLSRAAMLELVRRAAAGDRQAQGDLVVANRGLASTVVYKALGRIQEADRDDLLQEAGMAIVRAAAAFDPGRGCQWSTFATRCLWNAIRRWKERRHREELGLGRAEDGDDVDVLDELLAAAGHVEADHAELTPADGQLEDLRDAMERLPVLEGRAILLRYRLDEDPPVGPPRGVVAVAKLLPASLKRARELLHSGLERLRGLLHDAGLAPAA